MATCLLISGLARHVEKSYDNIFESLIRPNNPDVFIHTWLDTAAEPALEGTITKLYNPKKIVCENLRTWKNSSLDMTRMMNSYAKPYIRDNFVNTFYSAWYSVQQANLLKEQYRLQNDLTYDYAIRARFDINYTQVINCSSYDKNILHVSDREVPTEMIDDRFAFASNEIMNVYCNVFGLIDYVHALKDKRDGIFCGESLIYETCRIFGIPYQRINQLHCSHVR